MKFLLIGGAGFIGHHLAELIIKNGHKCVIIDNCTNYNTIPTHELSTLTELRSRYLNGCKYFNIDITNFKYFDPLYQSLLSDTDIVIHLAGYPRAKVVNSDPLHATKVMAEAFTNIVNQTVNSDIKRFVYISSSMVYGNFIDDVVENNPCTPIGLYGILKYLGEQILRDYNIKFGLPYTIIRPSAVYGPRDVTDRVISKFIVSAINDGILKVRGENEYLDFTYVSDLAEGIFKASLSSNTVNKTYNLTKGESRSIIDAAKIIIDVAGKGKIEITDRDNTFPHRGKLNIELAKNDFDYSPTISLEQGISKQWEWTTKHVRKLQNSI